MALIVKVITDSAFIQRKRLCAEQDEEVMMNVSSARLNSSNNHMNSEVGLVSTD
jgi:hypothetical protein